MDNFLATYWPELSSAIGILISLGGVVWAIKVSRGAKSTSEAAEEAAKESRAQISRELQLVDLQRAFNLISSIKTLQSMNQWNASAVLYPWLATIITDVQSRCPPEKDEIRSDLSNRRSDVLAVGDFVRGRDEVTDDERDRIDGALHGIENKLHDLASEAFAGPRGD